MKKFLLLPLFLIMAFAVDAQTIPSSGGTAVQVTGPLSIQPLPLTFTTAYQNIPYSSALNVQGGKPPYTCTLIGSMPTGITQSNCSFSGTPSGSGASVVSFTVTDSSTPVQAASLTQQSVTVSTLVTPFITITPTNQSILTSSTLQMKATPTWSIVPPAGALAADITNFVTWSCTGTGCSTVSTGGLFTASGSSGTPTINASFNSQSAAGVTVTVGTNVPTITNGATLCAGAVNRSYPDNAPANPSLCMPAAGESFSATGGSSPYTWSITSGCPSGLSFTGNVLGGTPTASGTFASCLIKVTDSATNSFTGTFSITIATVSSVTITPSSSPSVNVGATIQMAATANFSDSATANVTTGTGIVRIGSKGCGTASPTSSTSLVCTGLNIPANTSLLVGLMGCSGTGTETASTSDSDTVTFPDNSTQGPSGGIYFEGNVFYIVNPIANASKSITLTWSTSCGFQHGDFAWYSGTAASTPNDQHALGETNASTTLGTSCGSAAFTTTSANELLFSACINGSTNRSFTAGNNYNLIVTQAGGQSAIEDQIVSSIQTSVKSAMQFSGANDNHIGFTDTFTAASGIGATWSITAGSCTVNFSGLVTANSGTSCTVQASYGGQSGSQVITINSPTLQSIAITPNPANGTVNSASQLTATGTYVGGTTQNITTTAVWTSSSQSIATVVSGNVTCVAAGTATITAAQNNISGQDSITCTSIGTQSLLPGCTVSSANAVNFGTGGCPAALPAGWTLKDAEGFEGTVSEALAFGAAKDCTIAHTGSCSESAPINGDGSSTYMYKNLGTGIHDVYRSYWEWEDGNASTGEDNTIGALNMINSSGGQVQSCTFDLQGQSPNYISTTGAGTMECDNGGAAGATAIVNATSWTYASLAIHPGTWVQHEEWIHFNTTCTGSNISGSTLPAGDGFAIAYLNGVQIGSATNVNMYNCANPTSSPSLSAQAIVGLYFSALYPQIGGVCQPWGSSGTQANASPFSSAPKFQANGTSTCWGSQLPFKDAIDDVIIMSK